MLEKTDRWHYARPALARKYITAFELGLVSARGLFARRRMGKTQFLVKDLIPAAREAGFVAAYANLWANRTHPDRAIVAAVDKATAPGGLAKLLDEFKRPVKSVKASASLLGAEAGVETELTDSTTPLHTRLALALQRLDKSEKTLLLVLDEAQVLARNDHADFTHALRAELDTRKENVKVIFAGSSEATLRRMFGKPSEPFYNWAALEPFELLGRAFVDSMVERVNEVTRFELRLEDALQAFDALNSTPEFFRGFLGRYLENPEDGPAEALALTQRRVFADISFLKQWQALKPADQEVLRLLAHGVLDLHSQSALQRLGEALGLGKPALMSTVQNALRRLLAEDILARLSQGRYRFEDEAFEAWILQQEQDTG